MARDTLPGRLPLGPILRLAWRNLARNRRRTVITSATVAIAALLVQLINSVLTGVERQSFDNLISYQTGHAKVYSPGYFEARDDLPLDLALTDLTELQSQIEAVNGVAGVTPRLVFQAQLSNGVDQIPTYGVGIQVVGSDTDVFRIPQAVTAGAYLAGGDEGILLGNGLAQIFGVGVGEWLTVLSKTQAGAYEALDLPVVGLLGTGNPLIDRNSFLLPLSTAQSMLDLEGAATELAVRFAPRARESSTLRRLRQAAEQDRSLDVRGWREVEEDFMAFAASKRAGRFVGVTIFVALAMVGITNTVLMAAYERTREIGMMMAMGLRGRSIRTLFLAEGALTGLVGGGVGTLAALGVIALLSGGVDIAALYGDMDIGYPVTDRMYPAFVPQLLVAGWLIIGALAGLASLYPAARASRQEPVEALRHV